MSRAFSQTDFYELIGAKSRVVPKTAKKVWEAIQDIIVSELQNESYITLENFGKFEITIKGGTDEWFTNSYGIQEKKYIQPFEYVEFTPSKNYINRINSTQQKRITKAMFGSDELASYDDMIEDMAEPSVTEVVKGLLDKNGKALKPIKSKQPRYTDIKMGKPILCLNNNTIYRTTHEISKKLGISPQRLYYNFNRGKMSVCGYDFKFIDKDIKVNEVKNES